MSASGRATEFMRAWGEGHNKPHNPGCKEWGADDCDACTAEAYDPYEALVVAADIMGWRPLDPQPGATTCGVDPPSSLLGYGPCDSPAGRNGAGSGHVHTWPWRPGGSDPAGSDTGVADSDRGASSGTNLRPGGEPSPSRQGRPEVRPGAGGQPSGRIDP